MSKIQTSRVSSILKKISNLLESDPEFPNQMETWLKNYEKQTTKQKIVKDSKDSLVDVFDIYSKGGESGLRNLLGRMDYEGLRRIIMQSNLDQTKLSHKWKDRDRLTKFIMERVISRASKGKSFMSYGEISKE